jgi:hypothetical protein
MAAGAEAGISLSADPLMVPRYQATPLAAAHATRLSKSSNADGKLSSPVVMPMVPLPTFLLFGDRPSVSPACGGGPIGLGAGQCSIQASHSVLEV